MNTETVTVYQKGKDFEITVHHDQSGSAYGMPLSKNAYEQLRQHFVVESLPQENFRKVCNLSTGGNVQQYVVSGSLLYQVEELFAKLTDNERMEVLSDYCTYCGQNEKELGKCYCAPCYDE